jgi:RND family efflux transporter MFP subunit
MNCCFRLTWSALAILLLAGCKPPPPPPAAAAPAVNVALPIEREVPDHEEFTGRTDAVSRVDIRARVSGYLVKVNFQDGDVVKLNDLLYEIDRRPFQDALEEAEGALERLEAEKKLFDIQVDRYRKLAEKGAGSQQDLDEYLAKQAQNLGALKSAQAAVAHAQLNLDFTRIAAPIAGKISRTLLTAGNLVNADSTLLTTIMSIDPMYAYFNIEEPTLLRVQKMKREGVIKQQLGQVDVAMGLADDLKREFPLKGKLDFANNTVDPQTGTILVRGAFANPYELPDRPPVLMPGLFVRVRLNVGPPHKAFLVTERAIGTNQGQKYVYVVDKDHKIAYRRVGLGPLSDGLQAIEEGLTADDRVVINGLQRIRPGIEVKPEQVEMTAVMTK